MQNAEDVKKLQEDKLKEKQQNAEIIKKCLDERFSECDTVFIVPHNDPDVDAIGAAMGMALICKKNKKNAYIIINDDIESVEASARAMIRALGPDFKVINLEQAQELITDRSLMVAVDVNPTYRISTKDILDRFKSIVVIDHHKVDDNTVIKTPYLFVDEELSSACEAISRQLFLNKVKLTSEQANCLLAGIRLDTFKMGKSTGAWTFEVARDLSLRGANSTEADNLLINDFEHDKAIHKLVDDNTCFLTYIYAIACDKEDSGLFFKPDDLAKAAESLLTYHVHATFAIARIDQDTIGISARSKGKVDVGRIMKLFGGGGGPTGAAAQIKGMTLNEVKELLNMILIPSNLLSYSQTGEQIAIPEENSDKPMLLSLKTIEKPAQE